MDNKIDYRHNYIIMLDTETANTLITEDGKMDMSCVLAYDIGWMVLDTKGRVYERRSFVNRDIFCDEEELMQSAYYANKIPRYIMGLSVGERVMSDTYNIRKTMVEDMEKYHTHIVCAHNARFDINALNSTERWVTKSKYRYWFPYGTEVWDSMRMAQSVIGKMPTYEKFCQENGYLTKTGRLSMTAENLYRFITKDLAFEEMHMGIEDVSIEMEIMLYCFRQHKKMIKKAWG